MVMYGLLSLQDFDKLVDAYHVDVGKWTGTVSHYGEQTLGTLRLNARADGIGAEYLIIYRGN